jgi:hypothetical protein
MCVGGKDVVLAGFHSCVGFRLRCPSAYGGRKWSIPEHKGECFSCALGNSW